MQSEKDPQFVFEHKTRLSLQELAPSDLLCVICSFLGIRDHALFSRLCVSFRKLAALRHSWTPVLDLTPLVDRLTEPILGRFHQLRPSCFVLTRRPRNISVTSPALSALLQAFSPSLTKLALFRFPENVTLPQLVSLSAPASESQFASIPRQFPSLSELRSYNVNFTSAQFIALQKLPLRSIDLTLNRVPISVDAALAMKDGFKSLRALKINCVAGAVSALAELAQLSELHLTFAQQIPPSLEPLAALRLSSFGLMGVSAFGEHGIELFSSECLQSLASWPLTSLALSQSPLSAEMLALIVRQWPGLTDLTITECGNGTLREHALACLSGLRSLTALSLADCPSPQFGPIAQAPRGPLASFTDLGLEHVGRIVSLTSLKYGRALSGAGLVHLYGLPNLTKLDVSENHSLGLAGPSCCVVNCCYQCTLLAALPHLRALVLGSSGGGPGVVEAKASAAASARACAGRVRQLNVNHCDLILGSGFRFVASSSGGAKFSGLEAGDAALAEMTSWPLHSLHYDRTALMFAAS